MAVLIISESHSSKRRYRERKGSLNSNVVIKFTMSRIFSNNMKSS